MINLKAKSQILSHKQPQNVLDSSFLRLATSQNALEAEMSKSRSKKNKKNCVAFIVAAEMQASSLHGNFSGLNISLNGDETEKKSKKKSLENAFQNLNSLR